MTQFPDITTWSNLNIERAFSTHGNLCCIVRQHAASDSDLIRAQFAAIDKIAQTNGGAAIDKIEIWGEAPRLTWSETSRLTEGRRRVGLAVLTGGLDGMIRTAK